MIKKIKYNERLLLLTEEDVELITIALKVTIQETKKALDSNVITNFKSLGEPLTDRLNNLRYLNEQIENSNLDY